VCVFAGATSGIGASTLERMATMLHSPTFYVIGRSATRFVAQHTKLATLNPSCKIAFLEADVSLLSDVDVVCKQIVQAEKKLDYLYMSPGLIPLNGAQCSFPTSISSLRSDEQQIRKNTSTQASHSPTTPACVSSQTSFPSFAHPPGQ